MEMMMERLRSTNEVKLNWDGLYRSAPEWFKDAKFGLFFHWGPYNVPEWENEWYSRNMYSKGHTANKHHEQTYGPLSEFGYKDFYNDFKGENFNAKKWVDFIERCGAKYAGPVAEHADGFSMWNSDINPVNSVNYGPRRDVVGELITELKKRDFPVLASLHHAWFWGWFMSSDPEADVYNPSNEKFYGPILPYSAIQYSPYPLPDDKFCETWLEKCKEVVDRYEPDMIYFDSRTNIIKEEYRREFLRHFYKYADDSKKDVLLTYKQEDYPEGTAVHDIECTRLAETPPYYWQTDDKTDWKTWCHVRTPNYKSSKRIIQQLIDVVSKNGNLILNVGPKTDGTFPEELAKIMYKVGDWLKINGEAIYGTRPFRIHGEGPTRFEKPDLNEMDIQEFTAKDIRYTTKGKTLYAIVMAPPAGEIVMTELADGKEMPFNEVEKIDLVGGHENLSWIRNSNGLSVTVPSGDEETACVLRITGN